jgi:hypothetical protein
MKRQWKTYNFALVLSGISEPESQIEDALYEAGCDDAILSFRSGIAYVEFDREAEGFKEAILSAVRDVERASPLLKVVRVEPGDLVNAAEIARRVQCTREYIRLLTQGRRGEGLFPAPQSGITGKTLIWSWVEVAGWMFEHKKIGDESMLRTAETIRDINAVLEMRQDPAVFRRRLELLRELGAPSTSDAI